MLALFMGKDRPNLYKSALPGDANALKGGREMTEAGFTKYPEKFIGRNGHYYIGEGTDGISAISVYLNCVTTYRTDNVGGLTAERGAERTPGSPDIVFKFQVIDEEYEEDIDECHIYSWDDGVLDFFQSLLKSDAATIPDLIEDIEELLQEPNASWGVVSS